MIRLLLLTVAAIIVSGPNNVFAQDNTTTTTTTAAPTTPTPYADEWTVRDGSNVCIIFKGNVTVAVKYLIDNSTRSAFKDVDVYNANLMDDSSCSLFDKNLNAYVQMLHVTFPPQVPTLPTHYWDLWLYFTNDTKYNGGKAFGLYKVELKADYNSFKDPKPVESTEFFTSGNTSLDGVVGASLDHSSQCSTAELKITDNAKLMLNPFLVQAYIKNNTLGSPELCERDIRTSDIVPIVVGACLAALVIIVLVAYLIGRARAKRQGYASV